MRVPTFVLTLCVCFAASSVCAETTTYSCTVMEGDTGDGFISSEIKITHDKAKNLIMVDDAVIQYFYGKPIAAKLRSESRKRISYSWVVHTINNDNEKARMAYSLETDHDGGLGKVVARPGGYNNVFSAVIQCGADQA